MKFSLIKIYFKGGVLIPFYVSCFLSFLFLSVAFGDSGFRLSEVSNNPGLYEMLRITLYSGITGLCSVTGFLNSLPKIVNNIYYSLLSWFLLPYSCIAYVLATQVDWAVFRNTEYGNPILTSLWLIIFFFHFIGLIIGYQSFRATVLTNKNNEEIMNYAEEDDALVYEAQTEQAGDKTKA